MDLWQKVVTPSKVFGNWESPKDSYMGSAKSFCKLQQNLQLNCFHNMNVMQPFMFKFIDSMTDETLAKSCYTVLRTLTWAMFSHCLKEHLKFFTDTKLKTIMFLPYVYICHASTSKCTDSSLA